MEGCFLIFCKSKNKRQITSLKGCSALVFVCFYLHVIGCCMCVGEHVCALVVFVFPGHEHGWFCVWVGHDEVLVVRVFGLSLGVVHMWMWCLGLSVCYSPYPAICIRGVFCVGISTVSPVRPPSWLFTCHASKIDLCCLLDVSRTLVPSKSNLWPDCRQ